MTGSKSLLALVAEHERDGLADLEQLGRVAGLDEVELELELRVLAEEGFLLLAREPGHYPSACLTTAGLRLLRHRGQARLLELRAILAPLLASPERYHRALLADLAIGECIFCHAQSGQFGDPPLEHAADCPVLRREALLGDQ